MAPTIRFFNAIKETDSDLRGTAKQFVGDGTQDIHTPGLQRLTSVQIGTTPVPLTHTCDVPISPGSPQTKQITFPLAYMVVDDNKNTFVRRFHASNDGIWQDGEPVYIWGVWDSVQAQEDVEQQNVVKNRQSRVNG